MTRFFIAVILMSLAILWISRWVREYSSEFSEYHVGAIVERVSDGVVMFGEPDWHELITSAGNFMYHGKLSDTLIGVPVSLEAKFGRVVYLSEWGVSV